MLRGRTENSPIVLGIEAIVVVVYRMVMMGCLLLVADRQTIDMNH